MGAKSCTAQSRSIAYALPVPSHHPETHPTLMSLLGILLVLAYLYRTKLGYAS
jgi:hypothetical protein